MIDNDISVKAKRYNLIENTMIEDETGEYVYAADYGVLEQQLDVTELSRRSWMDEAKALEAKLAALEPVAWVHCLRKDLGQLERRLTFDAAHPYGLSGINFDKSYTVDSKPLCVWPGQTDPAIQLEVIARQIYDSWQTLPGFLPWVAGGNSLKQDEARAMARSMVSLAQFNQVEQPK